MDPTVKFTAATQLTVRFPKQEWNQNIWSFPDLYI